MPRAIFVKKIELEERDVLSLDPFYREVRPMTVQESYVSEGAMMTEPRMNVVETRYHAKEVRRADRSRHIYYVRHGDAKVFDDLIAVQQGDIDEIVSQNRIEKDRYWWGVKEKELAEQLREIKSLPWWKRLLNKF